jgi:hypothetical protein
MSESASSAFCAPTHPAEKIFKGNESHFGHLWIAIWSSEYMGGDVCQLDWFMQRQFNGFMCGAVPEWHLLGGLFLTEESARRFLNSALAMKRETYPDDCANN